MTDLSYIQTLALVCPLVFLAGFIDSIAGGGGVLSLPAYLAAGLPPHIAAGTNKCSAMFGTSAAAVKYRKSGNMRAREAALAAAAALPGAWVGTRLALHLSPQALRLAMLLVIPLVALFMAFRGKAWDTEGRKGLPQRFRERYPHRKTAAKVLEMLLPGGIGFCIGAYDGLIGPGTGTFLILAFGGLLGRNLVVSSGNAKLVNLASNIVSGMVYFLSGKVWVALALPAALASLAGGWIGSHMAIRGGVRVIRPVMLTVLALLFAKIAIDAF